MTDPRLVTDERAADEVAESWTDEPFFADLLYTREKLIEALKLVLENAQHDMDHGDDYVYWAGYAQVAIVDPLLAEMARSAQGGEE